MEITRRSFLSACAGTVAAASRSVDAQEAAPAFPWSTVRRELQRRYPDLRRHFVFEYYPWYASAPFRHWQQWGREPPVDIAANHFPLLGAYDSRSTRVIEQHARWIAESGVGVVDLSWWGRGSFSDRAVTRVMDVMVAHDIRVTFHLEPYGPQRVEQLPTDVEFLVREYGDRRHWDGFFLHERADGTRGPVFKLFKTILPRQFEDCHGATQRTREFVSDDRWRRAADATRQRLGRAFSRVTLLSDDIWNTPRVRAAGFDGTASYDPTIEPVHWIDHAVVSSRQHTLFSFNVNPGWDEIHRRKVEPGSCYQPRPFLPRTRELDWTRSEDREHARQLSEQRVLESLQTSIHLQTHPWLGNVEAGFFLTYITSFNEWHEGTSFEPMMDDAAIGGRAREVGYHNPRDGRYRLAYLTALLRRLL